MRLVRRHSCYSPSACKRPRPTAVALRRKTLAGWHVAARPADEGKVFWQVRDARSPATRWGGPATTTSGWSRTASTGTSSSACSCAASADSPGNSGIQFRSRYDRAAGWLDGPQVDVHPPAPWRTGLVYDETREAKRWIFPSLPDWQIEPGQGPREWRWRQSDEGDGWNEIHLTARGTRVTTVVNGLTRLRRQGVLDDAPIAGTTSGGGATSPSSSTRKTSS